jgi:hypothetical protein
MPNNEILKYLDKAEITLKKDDSVSLTNFAILSKIRVSINLISKG